MKETVQVDVAIIGAGIIGLTVAYKLKNKFPDIEIAIFDKEPNLGEHSSGRNSGVLHAGLYYPHQSLKHLLCLEGLRLWPKLASDLGITIKNCGKFIFSTSSSEEAKLNALFERAKQNNVPIEFASSNELKKLSQHVNAFNALNSTSTGIIDVSEALAKLKYNLESRDVHIFPSHIVKEIEQDRSGFKLTVNDFEVQTQKLINCAGLGAVDLRKKLGLIDLENYFVKGNYLTTTQKLNYQTLYYPIPPDDLKGLGVHSTIDVSGKVKFGPNTEEISEINYNNSSANLEDMKELVSFYFKNIEREKLYWDYLGIRSKIKNADKIHIDFWIKSPIKNYIETLGIESPGVTSAPAIAKLCLKI